MGELKKCPKCQSTKLNIKKPMYITELNSFHQHLSVRISSTPFSFVRLTKYMCFGCGYVENWIKTDDELKECILYVGVNNNEE